MKKTILFAALTFSSCWSDQPHFFYHVDCIDVLSEPELSLSSLLANVQSARKIIDREFGDGQFCKLMTNDFLEVTSERWFVNGAEAVGESTLGHVKVWYRNNALVHEMIHEVESSRCDIGTMWHENWVSKGFYDLDHEFERTAQHMELK